MKRARLAKDGVTQEKLGLAVGKTQGAISAYETNKNLPPFKVLAKIAAVLDVNPHELQGAPLNSVPVIKSFTPDGPLRDPRNISTYVPFPSERGNDVIGFALPDETGVYQKGDIIFICRQQTYRPQDQVAYLQARRVCVERHVELSSEAVQSIVGLIVGHYRILRFP